MAILAVAALAFFLWPQAAIADSPVVPSWSFSCDSAKKAAVFPIGIQQGKRGVTYKVTIEVIGKGTFGPVEVKLGDAPETLLVYAKGQYRITAVGGGSTYSTIGPQPIPCVAIAADATAPPTKEPEPSAANPSPAAPPRAASGLGSTGSINWFESQIGSSPMLLTSLGVLLVIILVAVIAIVRALRRGDALDEIFDLKLIGKFSGGALVLGVGVALIWAGMH